MKNMGPLNELFPSKERFCTLFLSFINKKVDQAFFSQNICEAWQINNLAALHCFEKGLCFKKIFLQSEISGFPIILISPEKNCKESTHVTTNISCTTQSSNNILLQISINILRVLDSNFFLTTFLVDRSFESTQPRRKVFPFWIKSIQKLVFPSKPLGREACCNTATLQSVR